MSAEERLREVRDIFHLNQRELAKKIGVTSQLISQMENGKTPISTMTARAIEAELGVSAVWLLFGTGDMVTEKRNMGKAPPDLIPALSYFPAVTEAMNQAAGKLTLADWQALNSFCMRMIKKETDENERRNEDDN